MDQASCFPRGSPFWILPPLPRVALSNRGYQQTNSITSRSTNDFKCHSGPLSWPVCRLCIPFDFVVVVVVWPTPPFVFSLDGRPTIRPRYRGRAREESSCSTVAAGTSSSSLLFFLDSCQGETKKRWSFLFLLVDLIKSNGKRGTLLIIVF